ncbi:MAG: glycosyl hydrolase [Armatimonadota bacterium]
MKLLSSLLLFGLGAITFGQVNPDLFAGMSWRNVGPARGGRSIAVAGSIQRPKEFFFGATGGGVWKSTDSGVSWSQVSDNTFGTASVGALAVAPSNPDIIIAGTGERDIRGNISHGDGVYRSKDGGKSWSHIGLKECQTISRIVIDPKDPDKILVAAFGHVYGPNRERGVYKTTDGGASWRKVLFESEKAGAVHITLDPNDSNTVLAATWEAWRTPYSMNSGGPGSKLWKSTDGGETWDDISRNEGLPKGTVGKIGFTISPVDSKRYYAQIEALDGGLFRSDDAGKTWQLVNSDRNWRQRAWYYTHVYAGPKNKDEVYALNVGFGKSTDGGKTFTQLNPPHGDNHDLWVSPDDPSRMIEANDGGANVSLDGGKTWTESTYSTGQFYHVTTDNAFPYRILGAQQDNSTIRIVSRKQGGNIGEKDWTSTAGGESGYIAVKPNDPDIVFGGSYGGDLSWINHRTGQSRAVDPWPNNPMGHGAEDSEYRFQWTYPILFSQHNPNVLYTCSQFVLKSTNMGQSWRRISPDLTRNDKSTMGPSGGPITKDNTSVEYYGTVFTLAESPKDKNVLWAGSDDGRIHVTRDGGRSWKEITPPTMPKNGLVSMIEASPFDTGTAYAAVDNHENDDYAPHAYRTTDYGATWTPITGGVMKDEFFRVIREDRKRKGLLYGGTERGVLVSFDAGSNWQPLSLNLPVTPVHDLAWKDDDLIAATHGRGFWVLDDVTPLQQLAPGAKQIVFAPKDPVAVRWGGGFTRRRAPGSGTPISEIGTNPLSGLVVSYYLPKEAKSVEMVVRDAKGNVVLKRTRAGTAGFQRTSLWLEYPSWETVPGMILWSGFPQPIQAPPGRYTLETTIDGEKFTHQFKWQRDPTAVGSDKDLVAQFEFLQRVSARLTEANRAVKTCRELREKNPSAEITKELTSIEEAIYQTKNKSGQDPLNYPIRLNDKLAGVFSNAMNGSTKPTDQAREVFRLLSAELQVQLNRLAVVQKQLAKP